MSDFISDLAAKSGISPEQAQKGLGAVLSFLKGSVPQETFTHVSAAVPESEQMMAAAGPHEEPSGGVMGTLKGMADKFFGGGGAATALIAKLSSLGITAEQAQSFLGHVWEHLKDKLPESATKQIGALFPAPQETHS
jgi:uncharacterized protein (DUF2267 family)